MREEGRMKYPSGRGGGEEFPSLVDCLFRCLKVSSVCTVDKLSPLDRR